MCTIISSSHDSSNSLQLLALTYPDDDIPLIPASVFAEPVVDFEADCFTSSSPTISCAVSPNISAYMFIDNVDIDNLPASFDVKVRNMFTSKAKLVHIMRKIAIMNNFEFKVDKSSRSRYYLSCLRNDCSWKFRASTLNDNKYIWKVTFYMNKHSCLLDMQDTNHKQASSSFIAACLKSVFVNESVAEKYTASIIIDFMRHKHGVEVSYTKALKARRIALDCLRGNAEQSYQMLPTLANALTSSNPGSYSDILLDSDGKFKYFFFTFGASIAGWRSCRPVLSVDGTFLKCKFKGTLLLAAALDGGNHIFPIGFSIVDSENDASWLWFFEKLKMAIGDRDDLVIISDRNSSIPKAISTVYHDAEHGICIQHLIANLTTRFKSSAIGPIFENCARAYTIDDYNFYMNALMRINPAIKDYLMLANPSKWARSHFRRRRYNIMTTNISECINSVLKDARNRPICSVLEAFRKLLQRWFFTRQSTYVSTQSSRSILTTWAEDLFHRQEDIARTLNVDAINDTHFEVYDKGVQEVVDIVKKTCTCQIWQLEDFPCCHAIAALWKKKLCPRSYVSSFYLQASFIGTYVGNIYPSGISVFNNDSFTKQASCDVLPPNIKRPRGRPKMKRYAAVGESSSKRIHCGRCGRSGHNKRSCVNEEPLSVQQVSKKKRVHLY